MQNKGKSADSAKNICGALEQQAQKNASFAREGKLFVKAFLLDASVNLNKWGVTPESIDKNINTFIGKPLLLFLNKEGYFDHPSPPNNENLNHWLSFQETYRVGTIIDVNTKINPLTGNNAYYAIIEVTNDDLKQSLRDNTVPLYVSPAIAEFVHPVKSAQIRLADGSELAENWTGVHLAIVHEPAYGVRRATINETCGGSEESCLLQLRKASIEKHGIGKCGFCVKKALSNYTILAKLAQKQPISNVTTAANNSDTSHATNPTSNTPVSKKVSTLENVDPTQTAAPKEQVEKVEERPITQQQPVQQQQPTKQAVQPPAGPYSVPELLQKISLLEQQIQLKDVKIEELGNINTTFGERVSALELERRREKIERIITAEVIKDQKQRLEKINYFTASSIPIEEIENLYRDVKVAIKKASSNLPRGRVPYGQSLGQGGVASYGNSVTVDEETGLTPLQKQLAVLKGGP